MGDELVDFGLVEAPRVNAHLAEDPFDLEAEDAVDPRPGGQSEQQDAGVAVNFTGVLKWAPNRSTSGAMTLAESRTVLGKVVLTP